MLSATRRLESHITAIMDRQDPVILRFFYYEFQRVEEATLRGRNLLYGQRSPEPNASTCLD